MQNPYEEIIRQLANHSIKYEVLEHEPVYTSEQAAKVRGLSLQQGAKSLLLKADNKFILIVLPGDKKLNSKKLKKMLGIKNLRFATPEEVKEIMGCEIGACYPIGTIIGIKPLVDTLLSQNEIISFNPGVHNKSIKIRWSDYQGLTDPELADIAV
ncbi:MAG: YbaK/prolyl-tRNA synthetase associated region [uncultured bacterium]|nr:MAG: YbaK/prolyl-tRNA synthetase associated region [uncultured bacterium]